MPATISCPQALLTTGWEQNVLLTLDDAGFVTDVATRQSQHAIATSWQAPGPVLAGVPNVHSHAFQRGFAGLAETVGPTNDDFWSWRQAMYRFLHRLTPDHIEAIAGQVFLDMLRGGYTHVGEFHYLHHQSDGTPYENRAELSERILRAARRIGIGITLLPTLYTRGGLEGRALEGPQKRFANSPTQLLDLIAQLQPACTDPNVSLGLGLHSLRAVAAHELHEVLTAWTEHNPEGPVHIHVAEQQAEVAESLAVYGQRPVEWLLDHVQLSHRWCLIHATHMASHETVAVAQTGTVVGLCPTTEANLGDGVFPAAEFLQHGGQIAVGSDSQVCLSPFQELRMLEYGQRLTSQKRNVLGLEGEHVGAKLYRTAVRGGGRGLSETIGEIAVGHRADLLVLDPQHPMLTSRSTDQILDAAVFAGEPNMITHVLVGGRIVIDEGHHPLEEQVSRDYRQTIKQLLSERGSAS